jgi:hypothetical protein
VKLHNQNRFAIEGYAWHVMPFFTQWQPCQRTALCIGVPRSIQARLETSLAEKRMSVDSLDPYSMHVVLLDKIVALYYHSVWLIRDIIRDAESVNMALFG